MLPGLPTAERAPFAAIASSSVAEEWSTQDLDAWLAESSFNAAARSRRIEQHLTNQAPLEASIGGILRDLGERSERLTIATVAGNTYHAVVKAVGNDFVVLHAGDNPGEAVIRFHAVAYVKVPTRAAVSGDGADQLDVTLAEVLPEMAVDRPSVAIITISGQRLRGELRSAGLDVVRLRTDDHERSTVYVPLATIAELVLH